MIILFTCLASEIFGKQRQRVTVNYDVNVF